MCRLLFFKTISEKASKVSLIKNVKNSRKAGIKKEEVPLMKKILSLVLVLMLALIPMAVAEEFNPADYPVAICMDSMNHPVHRIVQLGFLKAAEALGYTDAKVIGTEGGDTSEAFAAAEAFALEGGKGLLLWAGDSGCYETLASVASNGVVVGIPHFRHQAEDGTYPEGLAFNMACDPVLYGK